MHIIFGLLPLIASHGIMITQQDDGFCFFPIKPPPTLSPSSQPTMMNETRVEKIPLIFKNGTEKGE
jgi:hypothetical protein